MNLVYLNLSHNDLSTNLIPPELGQLKCLRKALFSNNKFKTIPIEIGRLINLEELDFSNNQLTSIPEEIGDLVNLKKYLYLLS